MTSNHPEVLNILSALTPHIQSIDRFKAQHLGNSLYGLQGMDSQFIEVRTILSELIPKVRLCTQDLSDQAVGNALYGLQGMNSDSAEVCEMLSALVPKIYSFQGELNARGIGNSLYGLQGVNNQLESALLLDYLYNQIKRISKKSITTQDLVFLSQMLMITLSELKTNKNEKCLKFENIKKDFLNEIDLRKQNGDKFFEISNSRSTAEERVRTCTYKMLISTSVKAYFNTPICEIFECDMVLRVPVVNKNTEQKSFFYINIEMEVHIYLSLYIEVY
jgi:hypothetical protein